jgi:CRISPR system Cascade subunit CasE
VLILVQSRTMPQWNHLSVGSGYLRWAPETRSFSPAFTRGQRLAFRLRANPTVKRHGKRCGLYREEEQVTWLQRKAEQGGFAIEIGVPIMEQRMLRTPRRGSQMEFLAVRFDGILRVADPSRFMETMAQGVGSAKAFGFGLLSVARVGN